MKIGFVFDDSLDSFDGVAQYVKTLGGWLSGQGHEVRYLVGQTKMEEWSGGKVYSLAYNQRIKFNKNYVSIPLPANPRKVSRVLKEEDFDVLHIQVPYSPFMAQYALWSAPKHTAVVGTFHIIPADVLAAMGARFLKVLYGRTLQRFDKIVSVSPAAANFAARAFKLKTDILPNVVAARRFAPVKKAAKNRDIVFLGRLVERKGCAELLKAFAILHERSPQWRLTVVGDGPERGKLERLAKYLRINEAVDFIGFIDESDKPGLLSSARVACFPSLYGESFGIVLIEAMAAGAGVVVGGDNAGYRSVLGERPQLLVDPVDAEALANRLETLLTDRKLAARLHAWQTEHVKRYDVEAVGPQIVELYKSVIAKHRRIRA